MPDAMNPPVMSSLSDVFQRGLYLIPALLWKSSVFSRILCGFWCTVGKKRWKNRYFREPVSEISPSGWGFNAVLAASELGSEDRRSGCPGARSWDNESGEPFP